MMMDFDKALEAIVANTPGPGAVERCPLAEAFGRVLATDAVSDVDLPPFDKAGMDGFAVRTADLSRVPATLAVIMDVPAGATPKGSIGPGQCASVMTGAPVPSGADAVAQVEITSGFGSPDVVIERQVEALSNLSRRGEILRAGAVVARAGTVIDVEEAGLLAAAGCDPVSVFLRPRVSILTTGDEVVPPSSVPGPSQIRDANGASLAAFVRSLGLEPALLPSVGDAPAAIEGAIEEGLRRCDCLLLTGGVSAGAYDFVADVLRGLRVDIHVRRIAIKPGKPTVFGTRGDKMVFGLPGNPVSAMVIARVLAAPALYKRMGAVTPFPRRVKALLLEDIRKKTDRAWLVHAALEPGDRLSVRPIRSRGSADLAASAKASCLIHAPREAALLRAGELVDVVAWSRSL